MSMDLADLGRIICQDFDNRVLELDAISSESTTKLTNDRNELRQLAEDDRAKLQVVREQIWKDIVGLLAKHSEERMTILYGLKDEYAKNGAELKTWTKGQGEDLKGWYEVGAYLLRKRTGR